MIDWRPIETAPRDGTPFLLGKVRDEVPAFVSDEYNIGWFGDSSGREYRMDGSEGFGEYTHWAPLTPPEEK